MGAVFGFARMLLRLLKKPPGYWAVVWDSPKPNIRYSIFPEYKAQRPPTPSDFISQRLLMKGLMKAFNVPWVEMEGQEADDVVATLSTRALNENLRVGLFSGDKDFLQLIQPGVTIFVIKKGITELEEYTPQRFLLEWGIEPSSVRDFKALSGDPSDNIRGLEGVGEKTALELIRKFGNLEGIYDNLDKLIPRLKESLINSKDRLFLLRDVISLNKELNIDTTISDLTYSPYSLNSVRDFFERLEFKSLLKEMPEEEEKLLQSQSERITVVDANSISWNTEDEFLILMDFESFNPSKVNISRALVGNPRKPLAIDQRTLLKPQTINRLKEILNREEIKVLTNDLKTLINFLNNHNLPLPVRVDDLSLLLYLEDPDQSGGVQFSPDIDYSELLKGLTTERLNSNLLKLYEEVELPLSHVLASMENKGIYLDPALLEKSKKEASERVREISRKAVEIVGFPFNLGSPQQVAEVLFEKLKLQPLKKGKNGYSTNVEVLKVLESKHPVVPLIMEYREVSKLISTYLEALPKFVNAETGRIHTTYSMRGTTTGRLSSRDPNLQNIPTRTPLGSLIRSAFIAPPGKVFISGDYSQIELRVLAHLSEEPVLIKAFEEEEDIHSYTASILFGSLISQVSREERRRAKTVNFGLIYGMSEYGLAQELGISRAEAREFIIKYFERMPRVKEYLEETLKDSVEKGLTETILGRRRFIPDLTSSNRILKDQAVRVAINTPIQGSAADIIKKAMVDFWRLSMEMKRDDGNLILQVHDELVVEAEENNLDFWAGFLKNTMEKVISLNVPIEANITFGPNWRDLKPWEA